MRPRPPAGRFQGRRKARAGAIVRETAGITFLAVVLALPSFPVAGRPEPISSPHPSVVGPTSSTGSHHDVRTVQADSTAPLTRPYPSIVYGTNNTDVIDISAGSYPTTATYDPANGLLYAPQSGSRNLSVIDPGTDTVVRTLVVGYGSNPATLDPVSQRLFVPNYDSNNITVLDLVHNRSVANISIWGSPTEGTYDPANGCVYEPSSDYGPYGSPNVTVLNGSTGHRITTINLPSYTGSDPTKPAYDPANGKLYVSMGSSYYGNNWVIVLNGSTNSYDSTLTVGSYPNPAVYDPLDGLVYATNQGTLNLSIIDPRNDTVRAGPGLGYGSGTPALDPTTGDLFASMVGLSGPGNVTVVTLPSAAVVARVPVGAGPSTPVLDPATGEFYVTDNGAANVSVLSRVSPHVVRTIPMPGAPATAVVDVRDSEVFVPTNPSFESVIYAGPLRVTNVSAAPDLVERGNETNLSVSFRGGDGPVVFAYAGLPHSCPGANTPRLPCTPQRGGNYSINATVTDSLGHSASGSTVLHVWVPPPPDYPVNFTEVGVPQGGTWTVYLNGSIVSGIASNGSTSSIVFEEPNGTYAYRVTVPAPLVAIPAAGNTTVLGGEDDIGLTVAPPPPTYALTFTESGLPAGTNWSVSVNGTRNWANTSEVQFPGLADGTYAFTVANVGGWSANPSHGSAPIIGGNLSISISFSNGTKTTASPSSPNGTTDLLLFGVGVVAAVAAAGIWLLRRKPPRPPGSTGR